MVRLSTYLDSFLTHLDVERGLSPHTVDAYRRDCGRFVDGVSAEEGLSRAPTDLVTEKSLFEFMVRERERGRDVSSVRRSLSALRTFFKFLVRERVLDENPAQAIETPKTWSHLPTVLEEPEIARLLDAAIEHPSRYPLRDRALLETLYATGLRVSELIGLRLEDLRRDLGILHCHGKGSRERVVPISKTGLTAIDEYIERERSKLLKKLESNLIFLSRGGKPLGREVVREMIQKYARLAGIPGTITPHTLRHSLATHLLRGGADLRTVQEILGHVKLETTEIYPHIERSELKDQHRKFHPRG